MTTTPAPDSQPRPKGRAKNEVRPIGSGLLSVGSVSVRFNYYTAASSRSLPSASFHKDCGGRLKQQNLCSADGAIVERADTEKGYEVAKGKYVSLTKAELETIESKRHARIDVVEFVPADTVDLVCIEKTYYLGPGPGADRTFKLLAVTMAETRRIAVGRWGAHDKLVLVRPHLGGLLLHEAFFADDVRSFEATDPPADVSFKPAELDLARAVINQLSCDTFCLEKHRDEYADRLSSAIERKASGLSVAPDAEIVDLARTSARKKRDKAG